MTQNEQEQNPLMNAWPLAGMGLVQQARVPWSVRRLRVKLAGLTAKRGTTAWFIQASKEDVPGSLVSDLIRLDGEIAELRERIKQKGFSA